MIDVKGQMFTWWLFGSSGTAAVYQPVADAQENNE